MGRYPTTHQKFNTCLGFNNLMFNKHLMNYSLLIAFFILLITGIIAYLQPFSLLNTRLHILSATITIFFIAYHLAQKYSYFIKSVTRAHKKTGQLLILLLCCWTLLLIATFQNGQPAQILMANSYEARHQKEIVRQSQYTATQTWSDALQTVRLNSQNPKELTGEQQVALSVEVRFPDIDEIKPAIAIWAESTTGSLIETLYLSEALAYSDTPNWHGHDVNRAEVLPIWRNRYTLYSGLSPDGKIDATTGATDNHSFSLQKYFTEKSGEYVIYFEMNVPFDTNDNWKHKVLGQPSVLYSAYMEHNENSQYAVLELTGTGDSSGQINYDLSSITTAKELVELILANGRRMNGEETQK